MTYVLQLGLIGICIALLPLSYVWAKADDNKFRKLVWLTTFLTLDLVRSEEHTSELSHESVSRMPSSA